MNDLLVALAEERFGINANPDDVNRLRNYILETYGAVSSEILEKVFSSGEAAGFLTVGETYFFREPAHFSFLKDMLPSFEKTGIRICSAAVASGCEAYSIAMLIEAYNRLTDKPLSYHIDAFDINPRVIENARQGLYGEHALREDGSCFRYMADPYLKKIENGHRVDDSLKKNIFFFVHNLMDRLSDKLNPKNTFAYDIIFFRNAFIYFTGRNRGRILSNLSAVLKEGGILIMGVSETAGVHCDDLENKNREDVFYFQKLKLPDSSIESFSKLG